MSRRVAMEDLIEGLMGSYKKVSRETVKYEITLSVSDRQDMKNLDNVVSAAFANRKAFPGVLKVKVKRR